MTKKKNDPHPDVARAEKKFPGYKASSNKHTTGSFTMTHQGTGKSFTFKQGKYTK